MSRRKRAARAPFHLLRRDIGRAAENGARGESSGLILPRIDRCIITTLLMNLAVISVSALALAVLISCFSRLNVGMMSSSALARNAVGSSPMRIVQYAYLGGTKVS